MMPIQPAGPDISLNSFSVNCHEIEEFSLKACLVAVSEALPRRWEGAFTISS